MNTIDQQEELQAAAEGCAHNGVRIEDLACEHYNCKEAEIIGGVLHIGQGGGMTAKGGESVQAFLFWLEIDA
tara:strand:+ start:551 stop:766 length:216 start_codon:yes stop_codon:yes gene_type:complete